MALTKAKISNLDTSIEFFQDPIILLNEKSTLANIDIGFVFNRNGGTDPNVAIYWNETTKSFTLAFTANNGVVNSNISVNSYANITVGNIYSSGYYYLDGSPFVSSGAANLIVQDEGNTLTTAVGTINFVGDGVSANATGNVVTVTISGNGNAGSNYSNVNVKAYTESMGFQNYGNANVASYLITNSYLTTDSAYSNVNVAAYLITNGYALNSGLSVYAWNANVTSANLGMTGYVDQANVTLKSYVDGQITAANAGVTAANVGMQGYVDLANSIQSAQIGAANLAITEANLGMKGYVDSLTYSNVQVATYLPTYSGNIANIRLGTSGVLTFPDGTTQITAGGSSGVIISEINTANTITNSFSSVTAIRFDKDTGFSVSNIGVGEVKVSLGSSFRTWVVAGQANLVAQGEDTVEFIAGSGISFTTDANSNPKSLTITSTGGGGSSTYSNVNVKAYTETMGFQNYGNANVTAYLATADINTTGNIITSGNVSANSVYTDHYFYANGTPFVGGDPLPSQAGHGGEYLTTNGSTLSWAPVTGGSGSFPVIDLGLITEPVTSLIDMGTLY